MLKQLKAILNAHKINERLKGENKELETACVGFCNEIRALEKLKKPEIKDILQESLGGKLEWFDYNELTPPNLATYYDEAQHILRTNIFNNEVSFLKANWGKQAILQAHEHDQGGISNHIQKMSWMLLGIEMLKLRLEGVPNPTPEPKPKENIHSAV